MLSHLLARRLSLLRSLDRFSCVGQCRTPDKKGRLWYRTSRSVDQRNAMSTCKSTHNSNLCSSLMYQLAAKYLFVRLLRGTTHLQGRTKTHWATWIGSTVGCGVFAFVICGAVPFFGSLIGLIGAIAYAPMAVSQSAPGRLMGANSRLSFRCIFGSSISVIAERSRFGAKSNGPFTS